MDETGIRGARGVMIVMVAVAALIAGFVAGAGTDPGIEVEIRTGTVGSISADADSVCIDLDPPGGEEVCQEPRLAPGEQLPATGTRVRMGFAGLPIDSSGGGVGSWLWFEELP